MWWHPCYVPRMPGTVNISKELPGGLGGQALLPQSFL